MWKCEGVGYSPQTDFNFMPLCISSCTEFHANYGCTQLADGGGGGGGGLSREFFFCFCTSI